MAYTVMYVIVTYHVLLVVRNNVKPLAIKTNESCLLFTANVKLEPNGDMVELQRIL